MTFKRAQVVMLPTNEKAIISKCNCKNNEHAYHCGLREYNNNLYLNGDLVNLYILSDDEIDFSKDYVYHVDAAGDKHIISPNTWFPNPKFCKKIIATTDINLKIEIADEGWKSPIEGGWNEYKPIYRLLPQPSTSFIKKFVEEYNKGNIITNVMVEYEPNCTCSPVCKHPFGNGNCRQRNEGIEQLKTNPKNNTITIKKVKDNFNKYELIANLIKYREDYEAFKQSCHFGPTPKEIEEWSNKWIEENI